MPKFYKLDSEDFEIKPDELLVIAIHSPGAPYYTLAHFLDQKMNWDLINIKDLYSPDDNSAYLLNVLSHVDEISRVQYFLIENRFEHHSWISRFYDVDHWLMVTGSGLNDSRIDVDKLLDSLNKTEFIFGVWTIDFDDSLYGGRVTSPFKYFQSLYDFLDDKGFILRFE